MLHSLIDLGGHSWAYASVACFVSAVLSAIFPWIAAEAVLVAFLALARSPAQSLEVLVLLVAGQMAGKAGVFWSARRAGAARAQSSALAERWRTRMDSSGRSSLVVLASSVVGFPPFFLVTIAAGACGMSFRRFFVAGTAGRIVRFGALVLLAHRIPFIGR